MVIFLLITIPPVKITWRMLERGHSYSVGGFNYINHPGLILRNSLQLAGLSPGTWHWGLSWMRSTISEVVTEPFYRS